MKAKEIKSATAEVIRAELGKVKAKIASTFVEWTNAGGTRRTCSYAAFGHTGKLTVSADTDKVMFESAVAVFQKVDSERRAKAAKGIVATVKASHSVKAGTASVTERMTGLIASKVDVTCQLANAQKLAQLVRDLGAELEKRAELERETEAKAKRDKAAADVADYLNGAPGVPSTFVPAVVPGKIPVAELTDAKMAEIMDKALEATFASELTEALA